MSIERSPGAIYAIYSARPPSSPQGKLSKVANSNQALTMLGTRFRFFVVATKKYAPKTKTTANNSAFFRSGQPSPTRLSLCQGPRAAVRCSPIFGRPRRRNSNPWKAWRTDLFATKRMARCFFVWEKSEKHGPGQKYKCL